MDTKALRQKILDLAIRGKLVPQDPNDEPASVLLERIRAEKQQMVKDGKLKAKDLKNDTIIFVGDDNLHYEKFSDGTVKRIKDKMPFDIPNSWAWVRLSLIFKVINGDRGKNYPAKSSLTSNGIPFISAVNLDGQTVVNDDKLLCLSESQYDKLGSGKLTQGDVVVCIRGSLGKHGIYPFDKGAIASSLVILRALWDKSILSKYLSIYLDSSLFFNEIKKYDNGSAQPNLAANDLEKFFIPIPPEKEMTSLMSTVEGFFTTILNVSDNQNEIEKLIVKLKSKILDLAIKGKLVPQDPTDESASILLERIRKEKEDLIKAGKLKRDKRESVIFRGEDNSYYETIGNKNICINTEIHYDIPNGWTVERLKNLYSINPKNDIANDETVISFVPMSQIDDQFSYDFTYELKQWKTCKKGFTHFADGDLGFAKISPCFENRKSVIFSNLKNGYGAGTTELYILRNFCEGLNPKYIILFLKSESFIERGVDTYSGTVGQQRIDKNIIMDTIIPIPPQNEQQRIAERVKQLFSILDSIQATIV